PGPPPHRGTNVWLWSPIGGWGDHNHTFAGDGHPYQWASARSEPAPVRERTSISANLAGSSSEEVTLPSQPRKKPSGTETSAGFVSGKIAKSTPAKMASSAPRSHRGEEDEHQRRDQPAPHGPQRAAGVEPLPVQRVQDRGQIGRGRHGECERDQEGHVQVL